MPRNKVSQASSAAHRHRYYSNPLARRSGVGEMKAGVAGEWSAAIADVTFDLARRLRCEPNQFQPKGQH
jgi:hypothetical protein